jgi:hypothetical protein
MQRVHRKKNLIYQDKDFEIQSLNSLVRQAKEATSERLTRTQTGDSIKSVHLPLHDLTEGLQNSLQQMHHHLQSLLMQKLGPDARNVIAAERARQTRSEKEKLKQGVGNKRDANGNVVANVTEMGQDGGDELELLNEYRERYATILAELMIAKERLVELEKGLQRRTKSDSLRRRLSDDIEELSEDDGPSSRRRRASSMGFSSGGDSSDG